MPFQIIRSDITSVRADAIVNTVNPQPIIGAGTETAIYSAAGAEQLLEARKQLGEIPVGEAAVTPAFQLPAKYIIHISSPIYSGGKNGEAELLRKCYDKALALAKEKECESIAFPLLASGSYGFPKDLALNIAVDAFRVFLTDNDMQITLVVFDRESVQCTEHLFTELKSYVDERTVVDKLEEEYVPEKRKGLLKGFFGKFGRGTAKESTPVRQGMASPRMGASGMTEPKMVEPQKAEPKFVESQKANYSRNTARLFTESESAEDIFCEEKSERLEEKSKVSLDSAIFSMPQPMMASAPMSKLDDYINQAEAALSEYLQALINRKGMTNAQVYKCANMDKKYFSKLINGKVNPTKLKLLSLAIALKLNLDETRDLLLHAGYAIAPNDKSDLVFQYYISRGEYDIYTIDIALFEFGLPTLTDCG